MGKDIISKIGGQITSIGSYISSRYSEIKRLLSQIDLLDKEIAATRKSLGRIPKSKEQTRTLLEEKLKTLHEQREKLRIKINEKKALIESRKARIRTLEKQKSLQKREAISNHKKENPSKHPLNDLKTARHQIYPSTIPTYDPDKHKKALLGNPEIREKLKSGEYNLVRDSGGRWTAVPNEHIQKQREEKEDNKARMEYLFSAQYPKDVLNVIGQTFYGTPRDIIRGIFADPQDFARGMESYYAEGDYHRDMAKTAKALNEYRIFKHPEAELISPVRKITSDEKPGEIKAGQCEKPAAPVSPKEKKMLDRQRQERVKKDREFFIRYRDKINAGEGYAARDEKTGLLKFVPKENAMVENILGFGRYQLSYYTFGEAYTDRKKHLKAAAVQIKDSARGLVESLVDPIGTASDTAGMISQIGPDPVGFTERAAKDFGEEAKKDPTKITKGIASASIDAAIIASMCNKTPVLRRTATPASVKLSGNGTKPAPEAKGPLTAPEVQAGTFNPSWSENNIKRFTVTPERTPFTDKPVESDRPSAQGTAEASTVEPSKSPIKFIPPDPIIPSRILKELPPSFDFEKPPTLRSILEQNIRLQRRENLQKLTPPVESSKSSNAMETPSAALEELSELIGKKLPFGLPPALKSLLGIEIAQQKLIGDMFKNPPRSQGYSHLDVDRVPKTPAEILERLVCGYEPEEGALTFRGLMKRFDRFERSFEENTGIRIRSLCDPVDQMGLAKDPKASPLDLEKLAGETTDSEILRELLKNPNTPVGIHREIVMKLSGEDLPGSAHTPLLRVRDLLERFQRYDQL